MLKPIQKSIPVLQEEAKSLLIRCSYKPLDDFTFKAKIKGGSDMWDPKAEKYVMTKDTSVIAVITDHPGITLLEFYLGCSRDAIKKYGIGQVTIAIKTEHPDWDIYNCVIIEYKAGDDNYKWWT